MIYNRNAGCRGSADRDLRQGVFPDNAALAAVLRGRPAAAIRLHDVTTGGSTTHYHERAGHAGGEFGWVDRRPADQAKPQLK